LYINVATPAPPHEWLTSAEEGGPVQITVTKSHIIGFEAGRSVVVMSVPEGDFVEVVGESEGDEALVLPAGGVVRQVLLQQPWLIELPSPTQTFFWFGDSMRSFQGPVTVP
jgi:ribosomal protein L2